MSKYTKGPWTILNGNGDRICAEKNGMLFVQVATVDIDSLFPMRRPPIEQRKANARLIAAAPDLLEACEAVQRDCDLGESKYSQLEWAAIQKCVAAIAKATGGE